MVLARYPSGPWIRGIEGTLEGRFRLTINRAKTRIVKLTQPSASLDFLGFTRRYDRARRGTHRYLNGTPSAQSMARARDRVRELTGPRRCFVPIPAMIAQINRFTKGWGGYFRHGFPGHCFRKLNWFVQLRLRRHLHRRSQRPYRPPAGESFSAHLQRLGLPLLGTTPGWLPAHALHRGNSGKPDAGNPHVRFDEGGGEQLAWPADIEPRTGKP